MLFKEQILGTQIGGDRKGWITATLLTCQANLFQPVMWDRDLRFLDIFELDLGHPLWKVSTKFLVSRFGLLKISFHGTKTQIWPNIVEILWRESYIWAKSRPGLSKSRLLDCLALLIAVWIWHPGMRFSALRLLSSVWWLSQRLLLTWHITPKQVNWFRISCSHSTGSSSHIMFV